MDGDQKSSFLDEDFFFFDFSRRGGYVVATRLVF